jgi:hypothetical protein
MKVRLEMEISGLLCCGEDAAGESREEEDLGQPSGSLLSRCHSLQRSRLWGRC